jgi:hypothetical protein
VDCDEESEQAENFSDEHEPRLEERVIERLLFARPVFGLQLVGPSKK